jgi:hypothetical protein
MNYDTTLPRSAAVLATLFAALFLVAGPTYAASGDTSGAAESAVGVDATASMATAADPVVPYHITIVEPSSAAPASQDDDDWIFKFAPYVWMPAVKGTVGARGRTVDVDASFSDIFDRLNVAGMMAFEARKDRFGAFFDVSFVVLDDTVEPQSRLGQLLIHDAEFESGVTVISTEVNYRIAEDTPIKVDVLGGMRIWRIHNQVTIRPTFEPNIVVEETKSWVDPEFGLRFVAPVNDKFAMSLRGDIGGFGAGSDFTWQMYGGGNYQFTDLFGLFVGYRHRDVDYDDEKGFLFDVYLTGFVTGVGFSF